MQRLPPQIVAPTAVQSAFVEQVVAAALLHVSQKHLFVVKPEAWQFGLAALSVNVCVPVASCIVAAWVPAAAPGDGGQSKLTGSDRNSPLVPVVAHGIPLRTPPLHTFDMQVGHGCDCVIPLYVVQEAASVVSEAPASGSRVPVADAISVTMHVLTPPTAMGWGGP